MQHLCWRSEEGPMFPPACTSMSSPGKVLRVASDRKSTRLNSSHSQISYAVFCLKKKIDDVALGVCKTGAEEAGVTEVRTSLSEKKFELWREIKVLNMIKLLIRQTTAFAWSTPQRQKLKF